MSQNQSILIECDGELIDGNRSFSSDVYWEVFTCSKCLETVFTVEGGVHWWNAHGEPSKERAARQTEIRPAGTFSSVLYGRSSRHEMALRTQI
jgi:hypothetical protein